MAITTQSIGDVPLSRSIPVDVPVDAVLDESSTNPVQNSAAANGISTAQRQALEASQLASAAKLSCEQLEAIASQLSSNVVQLNTSVDSLTASVELLSSGIGRLQTSATYAVSSLHEHQLSVDHLAASAEQLSASIGDLQTSALNAMSALHNHQLSIDELYSLVNQVSASIDDYTSFDVIACDASATVHSQLPDEEMFNKAAISSSTGEELLPATSTILGNGFRHSMVVRCTADNGMPLAEWMSQCGVVVHWGDGTSTAARDIFSESYDPSTGEYDTSVLALFVDDNFDNENEVRIRFQHTYESVGRYTVTVYGREFFNIQMGDRLLDSGLTGRDVSLLCEIYDGKHKVAKRHTNHTRGAALSPLLLEVHVPTQMEMPWVKNHARMFSSCANLRFATGLMNKLRGSYSGIEMFYSCRSLLATDYTLLNTGCQLTSANSSAFQNCSLLGSTFIDYDGNVRTVHVDDLLPPNGFNASARRSFKSVFSGCASLQMSDAAFVAAALWDNSACNFYETSKAFYGCTSIGLSSIPASWGGTTPDDVFFGVKVYKLSDSLAILTERGQVKSVIELSSLLSTATAWTFNTLSSNCTVQFTSMKSSGDSATRFVAFEPGQYEWLQSSTTSVQHTYASAGTHTVMLGGSFYNAKPGPMSCLADADFVNNASFKFVGAQFAYATPALSAVHGVLSNLASSNPAAIFGKSTLDNLNFMSALSGVTTLNASMFYISGVGSRIADVSFLNQLSDLVQINANAFRATTLRSECNLSATKLSSIGADAFRSAICSSYVFPLTLESIGSRAFLSAKSGVAGHVVDVSFIGKTEEQLKSMATYPFGLSAGSVISCLDEDGTPLTSFVVETA